MRHDADVLIVGAGVVGSAIALGIARRGLRVLLLDGADSAQRASRANAGLVWVQGKGRNLPSYRRLTRASVRGWSGFAKALEDLSDIDVHYRSQGGLTLCLGEAEYAARAALVESTAEHMPTGGPDTVMLTRAELRGLAPGLRFGETVQGASFCQLDGQVDPFRLSAALGVALSRAGVVTERGVHVHTVRKQQGGFLALSRNDRFRAAKIVIAAGNDAAALARQIGICVSIRPQAGQLLVTERVLPFLPLPISSIHQTGEGTLLLGSTHEDKGFDTGVTAQAAQSIAQRAVSMLPALAAAVVVRQWAGLRLMTDDGAPIYARSRQYPDAYLALAHSGVTLTPVHANELAHAIVTGDFCDGLCDFGTERFDV